MIQMLGKNLLAAHTLGLTEIDYYVLTWKYCTVVQVQYT